MKYLSHFSLLLILILWFVTPAYSSWTEYNNIRYLDLDGDLADEIIIESKQGAGSNHYIEDMRIFKDKYPELELIFTVRILDSYFGLKAPNNYNIVSDVNFTEQTPENKGIRDIIVASKKVYFKDKENKVIDKEEDLGTKVFTMYGGSYTVNKVSRSIDLDNNGTKELVVAQQQYETISEDSPLLASEEIITVSGLDGEELGSFSMPDHMGELELVSLNNDGLKQIVARSYGGAHYTNIAIYGYKDGGLYKIFEDGSACGVDVYFDDSPPLIKVGRANWGAKEKTEDGEEIDWSYASEPLWQVYRWDGKQFVYDKKLSSAPDISEEEEVQRFVDRSMQLLKEKSKKRAGEKP